MTRYSSIRLVVCAVVLRGFLVATLAVGEDQANRGKEKNRGLSAVEMMQRAHDARAEWTDFKGFKADVVVIAESTRVDGTIVVTAEGNVELELADSELGKWAQEDLQSLVDHRLPGGDREYDVDFVRGERPNALGRLIRFNDDRMHSVYRIRRNVITEVHRSMGDRKLMINVVDVQRTKEKRILPRTYTVTWTDVKTGDVSSMQVTNNRWVRIDKFDLPSRVLNIINKETGDREVREIRLSNHELLVEGN